MSVHLGRDTMAPRCRWCVASKDVSAQPRVATVALPYVFRYLVQELGAFSIRCSVATKDL